MQFDDQQNVDSSGQGNPFDPLRQAAGDRANDARDEFGNRVPGGQQSTDPTRQAAGQGLDSLQQQGQQGSGQAQPGMGGLGDSLQQQGQPGMGGLGDMLGNQGTQPGQGPGGRSGGASADPNNPYGNVDDVIADYGNTQNDQGQQGVSNV
jgi:hypothetical protein